MEYCADYFGIACPNAQEDEDGRRHPIKCGECWYYRGCEDCAAAYYGFCPEGKEDAE